jgi:chorismate mutase
MARALRPELDRIRTAIDATDNALVGLLVRRRKLVLKLAMIKKPLGIPVHDPKREGALLERLTRLAARGGLEKAFVAKLFKLVMADSKKAQRREAVR